MFNPYQLITVYKLIVKYISTLTFLKSKCAPYTIGKFVALDFTIK